MVMVKESELKEKESERKMTFTIHNKHSDSNEVSDNRTLNSFA